MKKHIFRFFIFVLLSFFLFCMSGCDYRAKAVGNEQEIFVFADSVLWLQVNEEVLETFNAYVHTPRAEKSFNLLWQPLQKLNDYKNRMNLIFVGTTEKGGEVNQFLRQSIPEDFIQNVNQDKNFYFFKDDLFASDQLSLFMLAKDTDSFKQNFANLQKNIFLQFNNKHLKRLEKIMFARSEQVELQEFLENNYGYGVRIQHDYFLANQNPDEKYVWLRRLNPDRWVSIWKVADEIRDFPIDTLIVMRNEMARKYYGGDKVVLDETRLDTVLYRDEMSQKLTGTWRNDSLLIGGPFRTYVVPDNKNAETYLVDIVVMAPDKDKKPFLDQLEVIAGTFRLNSEKTEE